MGVSVCPTLHVLDGVPDTRAYGFPKCEASWKSLVSRPATERATDVFYVYRMRLQEMPLNNKVRAV
jgi:hypothetical protein